jgi:hypothetical protein
VVAAQSEFLYGRKLNIIDDLNAALECVCILSFFVFCFISTNSVVFLIYSIKTH